MFSLMLSEFPTIKNTMKRSEKEESIQFTRTKGTIEKWQVKSFFLKVEKQINS